MVDQMEDVGQEGEGQPIGGHDAQQSALPEPSGVGGTLTGQVREHERSVEQEAGDEEEDRDPDLQTAGVHAQRVPLGEPGDPGGVEEEYRIPRRWPAVRRSRETVAGYPPAVRLGRLGVTSLLPVATAVPDPPD